MASCCASQIGVKLALALEMCSVWMLLLASYVLLFESLSQWKDGPPDILTVFLLAAQVLH